MRAIGGGTKARRKTEVGSGKTEKVGKGRGDVGTKGTKKEATRQQGDQATRQPGDKAKGRRGTTGRRDEGTQADAKAALWAYRARQKSVADILDHKYGPLEETDHSLWERRAYLMLVGMVYTRMVIGEDNLPTDEFASLSRILAENRRVEIQRGESLADVAPPGNPGQALETAVRDVYGLTLSSESPRV